MGQVLGFSHCQEYGSVASTPDSTPPCTDGGNEESELCELQTARDWSEDEDLGADLEEEDEGLGSSPSIWGTPRQHAHEQTFSYFTLAEAEAAGASRHHHPRRNRAAAASFRPGRSPLRRDDTLDSPDLDWAFQAEAEPAAREEEEEEGQGGRGLVVAVVTHHNLPLPQQEVGDAAGSQRGETEGGGAGPPHAPPSSQQEDPPRSLQAADLSPRRQQPAVAMETISVALLTSVGPQGSGGAEAPSSSSSSSVSRDTQEHLASLQWCAAFGLSEEQAQCIQEAVMDLIYWKETERTGMVLTGLVVVLLSLFQLSIISVVSTLSLAAVCGAISVRVYYKVLHILNWADGEHPFKKYLEMEIGLRGEMAEQCTQKAIVMATSALDTLKNLVFVANLVESLKFLVLAYLVTFLGRIFTGLTVFIIGVIAVFSVPLFYKQRQEQVDSFLAKLQAKVDDFKDTLQRIIQGGGPTPDPTPGGAKPKSQ